MLQARPEVGVIGSSGNLGRPLTARIRETELFEVITYDVADRERSTPLEIVMARCAIVHVVAAPLSNLTHLEPRDGQTIVLHASVMNESREFNTQYLDGKAAVVHMLMNEDQKVVVASDAPHSYETAQHMTDLSYNPQFMTIDEHDKLMAATQGFTALLTLAKLAFLNETKEKGLLTPSSEELAVVLRNRNFNWTQSTIDSLTSNPWMEEEIMKLLTAWREMGYNKGNE